MEQTLLVNPTEIRPTPHASRRRRLVLWLLSLLLFTLALLGQWYWLTRTLTPPSAPVLLPAERAPLLDALLRQKVIVWSLMGSAAGMVMAMGVAISPLPWWLYGLTALGKLPGVRFARTSVWGQTQQSAEEWVAAQAALLQLEAVQGAPSGQLGAEVSAAGQEAVDPALPQGQLPPQQDQVGAQQPDGSQAGAQPPPPGTQHPGAPQPQTPPGTQPTPTTQPGAPQPGAPQPGAQPTPTQPAAPQPGAPQPGTQQPGAPQPGAPQPPTQQGLQQLLAQEENVDLKELTDIGDILSTFKDNDDVSPQLLALSQSLEDVDVEALVYRCRRVASRLASGR